MIIYITRDENLNYAVSNLYEDGAFFEVEAEMPDDEYEKMQAADKAYWELQEKIEKLYKGSPRRDKR